MSRKRTRKVTLVLLGVAGALTTGCGNRQVAPPPGVGAPAGDDNPAAKLDEATAKRLVAASTGSALSDGYAHASAILASGPITGGAAPLNLARLAYLTDQAVETYDVAANQTQLPPPPGHTPRQHYHYHRGPGIGWFLFGYGMARMFSGPRPYTPSPFYGGGPRPVNPTYGNRSHFPRKPSGGGAGAVAGGRSPVTGGSRPPATGGGVSRGGFGGVGGGHATGGS
jgi:hypothetical protein